MSLASKIGNVAIRRLEATSQIFTSPSSLAEKSLFPSVLNASQAVGSSYGFRCVHACGSVTSPGTPRSLSRSRLDSAAWSANSASRFQDTITATTGTATLARGTSQRPGPGAGRRTVVVVQAGGYSTPAKSGRHGRAPLSETSVSDVWLL